MVPTFWKLGAQPCRRSPCRVNPTEGLAPASPSIQRMTVFQLSINTDKTHSIIGLSGRPTIKSEGQSYAAMEKIRPDFRTGAGASRLCATAVRYDASCRGCYRSRPDRKSVV